MDPSITRQLTESLRQVAEGRYQAAQELFDITASETQNQDTRESAEAIGLMCVKVEAREFQLGQALESLRRSHTQLAETGVLFCSVVSMLCFYVVAVYMLLSQGILSQANKSLVMLCINVSIIGLALSHIRRHRHDLAAWGLTWTGAYRAIQDSLLWSLPIALIGIGIRAWLVQRPSSPFFGRPLLESFAWWWLLAYAGIVIVEEIAVRSVLQTSVERFVAGRHPALIALFMASLIFGTAHLFYSVSSMAVTFVASLFFGWLYLRHRTVTGACVAHYLLGLLYIFGLHLVGW